MIKRFGTFLWLLIFLTGATASILYVQGFRFSSDSRKLVPTGVLEISTVPSGALLFVDGKFQGITPQILRGQKLGKANLRLEKSGFHPYQAEITITPDFITHLRRFFLVPVDQRPVELGPDRQILWDPEKRGYLRILAEQKTVQVFDFLTAEKTIEEFPRNFQEFKFLADGSFQIRFEDGSVLEQDFFSNRLFSSWKSIAAEQVLSPEQEYSISLRGPNMYLKNIASEEVKLAFEAGEPILDAWWMEESDDILIATRSKVLLWNAVLRQSRVFAATGDTTEAFYIPEAEVLVYKNSEKWLSLYFGLPKPFIKAGETP